MESLFRVPGKLMLAGEYAVLDGSPAVVAAVDRYVAVRIEPCPREEGISFRLCLPDGQALWVVLDPSVPISLPAKAYDRNPRRAPVPNLLPEHGAGEAVPPHSHTTAIENNDRRSSILAPCLEILTAQLGPGWLQKARSARVTVDSAAFGQEALGRTERVKLGFGSSAASAVAILGALLDLCRGIDGARQDRDFLVSLADKAHREAQGGVGSGADVAASVYGGLILYRQIATDGRFLQKVQPISPTPTGCCAIACWTGKSASTKDLVDRVWRWRRHQPGAYQRRMAALSQVASGMAGALAAGDGKDLLASVDEGYGAMDRLARESGLPLVLDAHVEIRKLARRFGGTAKPTGAGGGDLALALLPSRQAAERFLVDLSGTPGIPIPLGLDPHGFAEQTSPTKRSPRFIQL